MPSIPRTPVMLGALALVFAAKAAWAGPCSSPSGSEGNLRYDSASKSILFCNGTAWTGLTVSGSGTPVVPATDTSTSSVSLLLKAKTSPSGNRAFLDSSPRNFAISATGNVAQGTFAPSGTSVLGSAYFDGNGDYLTIPSNPAFAFGTGNFTIEFWLNLPNPLGSSYYNIYDGRTSNELTPVVYIHDGRLIFGDQATSELIVSNLLPANTWIHVALVRSGATATLYFNGKQEGAVGITRNYVAGNPVVGVYVPGNSSYLQGYLADFRVSDNARYTANFALPTSPVSSDANAVFLARFGNTGLNDAVSKNDIETVGNAAGSSAVTKFSQSVAAFDGNGDYLTLPHNADLSMDYRDFTLESWVYLNAKTPHATIMNKSGVDSVSYPNYALEINNAFVFSVGQSSASCCASPGFTLTGTTNPALNTWYHVEVSKSGSVYRLFVNGSLEASTVSGFALNDNGARPLTIGYEPGKGSSYYLNGYLHDLRITKGVARHLANFTPPSAAY